MHFPAPLKKAYLEFFCPPQHVEELLEILNDNPSITYHAVNKQGDFRSNTAPGPNAVTWGVFPGAEVIQPTVVDSAAFQAWKDEAYELGSQWAQLYQETSPETQKLIHSVFDEYHLGKLVAALPFLRATRRSLTPNLCRLAVNIVYNDYRDPDEDAVFKPFFELASKKGLAAVNGH